MGRRKKKKASTLPGDVSGEPDQNGEVSRMSMPGQRRAADTR